jgi:uncharacterized protein YqgV (UPF0045/DUF77 family)
MASQSDRVMMNIKIDDRKGVSGAIRKKVQSVKDRIDP